MLSIKDSLPATDPAGDLFQRHLPPTINARRLDADVIRADYARLAALLDDKLTLLIAHYTHHGIEAWVCAAVAPDRARYYVADIGHAVSIIDELLSVEVTAVPHEGFPVLVTR